MLADSGGVTACPTTTFYSIFRIAHGAVIKSLPYHRNKKFLPERDDFEKRKSYKITKSLSRIVKKPNLSAAISDRIRGGGSYSKSQFFTEKKNFYLKGTTYKGKSVTRRIKLCSL